MLYSAAKHSVLAKTPAACKETVSAVSVQVQARSVHSVQEAWKRTMPEASRDTRRDMKAHLEVGLKVVQKPGLGEPI